jgi:hypothetical protein
MSETREQQAAWLEAKAKYYAMEEPELVDALVCEDEQLVAALRAGAQALREQPQPCQWKYDDHNDTWETACGRTWVYECDGPVENKVHFCQGCGGKVALPPAPSQET